MKPRFHPARVLREIRRTFPRAKMRKYYLMRGGLVSPVYKVVIAKPRKMLAVKIYKAKNALMIQNNNKIIAFLYQHHFPVPKIHSNRLFAKQGVVIMECLAGRTAAEVYEKGSDKVRKKLLQNAGKLLRRLHGLNIPEFWIHHKHEVKDARAWLSWTKKRIKKYIAFAQAQLKREQYLFLRREFTSFFKQLNKNMDFVPLHWDYHFANLAAESNGRILGLFDFDNAMKGHTLADIGQAKYWLWFRHNDYQNFIHFLEGYGAFTTAQKQIMIGYALLHLVATSRSLWTKKRHKWIIKKHEQMIEELMKEKKVGQ